MCVCVCVCVLHILCTVQMCDSIIANSFTFRVCDCSHVHSHILMFIKMFMSQMLMFLTFVPIPVQDSIQTEQVAILCRGSCPMRFDFHAMPVTH